MMGADMQKSETIKVRPIINKNGWKIENTDGSSKIRSEELTVVYDKQYHKTIRHYEVITIFDDGRPDKITYERVYANEVPNYYTCVYSNKIFKYKLGCTTLT